MLDYNPANVRSWGLAEARQALTNHSDLTEGKKP